MKQDELGLMCHAITDTKTLESDSSSLIQEVSASLRPLPPSLPASLHIHKRTLRGAPVAARSQRAFGGCCVIS